MHLNYDFILVININFFWQKYKLHQLNLVNCQQYQIGPFYSLTCIRTFINKVLVFLFPNNKQEYRFEFHQKKSTLLFM